MQFASVRAANVSSARVPFHVTLTLFVFRKSEKSFSDVQQNDIKYEVTGSRGCNWAESLMSAKQAGKFQLLLQLLFVSFESASLIIIMSSHLEYTTSPTA